MDVPLLMNIHQHFSYQDAQQDLRQDLQEGEENPRANAQFNEMEDLLEAHKREILTLKAELQPAETQPEGDDTKLRQQSKIGESLAKQLTLNETLRAGMSIHFVKV